KNAPLSANAFINANKEDLKKSSSGGAFTAIAKIFCDGNYAIFGAKYDGKSKVWHDYIEDISQIDVFRKSKYLQSDVGNSYILARDFLKQGKKVIFTGTPCQIAALKLFLKKDYENLLTLDLSCYGINNSKLVESYLRDLENFYGKKIISYSFREKHSKFLSKSPSFSKITFENGKSKYEAFDLLYRGFISSLFKREGCYNCKYVDSKRVSDFTLADFWGIRELDGSLTDKNGCSLLLVNTEKAANIAKKLKNFGIFKEFPMENATRRNYPLAKRRPSKIHPLREEFLLAARERGMLFALNKYVPKKIFWHRLVYFAARFMPNKLRTKWLKFFRLID
ncbi:MAG: Coenzyme F420 hydrogenase/dehydrogenase, beta subunit C-terminal domain, partial [Opitutales bacterium]|nr:Coenzyme F420 hydrogenase/dehydrogenase, beta subunit C-terminal domain [Opitutales bacterium]